MFALAAWCIGSSAIAQDAEIAFNRDIRPILSDACFACHGPDKHARQADLRLDDRAAAIEHGAIVAGDSGASSILERILSDDPDLVMPPPKTGKKLSEEQIALLRRWIDAGAAYQSHWAFEPLPATVSPPVAQGPSKDWIRNDIDRFALERMQRAGFTPAPEVEPIRWLRRARLDLTGLPPTLEEINEISADASEAARERMVDRWLASDAYAERMANMWLDVARYADTFGYQADVNMEVWPWRDWLIRAFQENLSYDQFILWQLAGDLLPNATDQQQLATTFNRLHRQTNEGGSIEEEFRQVYLADRTVTAGTAFLGLTLECSRCHDHKYDPISQRDFYSIAAFFADIDEHGLYSHFTRATPTPALALYSPEQKQQHAMLREAIASAEKKLADWIASHPQKGGRADALPAVPETSWHFPLEGSEPGALGMATKFNGDDAVSFPLNRANPSDANKPIQYQLSRPEAFSLSLWVQPSEHAARIVVAHQSVAAEDAAFRGFQLVLEHGKPQVSLIHFWPGDAIRVEAVEAIPLNSWTHLGVVYDGSSRADGVQLFVNGREVAVQVLRDQLTRDIRYLGEWGDSNANTVQFSLGARFRDIGFRDGCIDELRVYDRALSNLEIAACYAAAPKIDNDAKQSLLENTPWDPVGLRSDPEYAALCAELTNLRRQENDLVTRVRQIMAMQPAKKPRMTHILERGAYDAPRDTVEPALPLLGRTPVGIAKPGETRATRLDLAKWLISPDHPLTSRVAVNRFWSLFFGRGIVSSLEDFGSQGTVPSHPELLDWLARDFIQHEWNVHHLCKQIVLSATYRQESRHAQAEWDALDPSNQWLARGPRHRLSAEQIRDGVLAASGLLVQQVGGPSVMPYQPAGLWEEAGTGKSYQQAQGDGLYRRSMYTFWRRTAPPPTMLAFDATSRETCTAKRESTTTPLQALALLNDPQTIEAARAVAETVHSASPVDRTNRWREMGLRLLQRPVSEEELRILETSFQEQHDYFQSHEGAAKAFLAIGDRPCNASLPADELAATTVVALTLICFDDFVMKR